MLFGTKARLGQQEARRESMSFGKREATGYGGVERRRHIARVPVDILTNAARPIDCRIVSMSTTGARLSLPSILGIPESFELRAFGQTHRVKVSRRGARYIAVRFLAPLQIMPHV